MVLTAPEEAKISEENTQFKGYSLSVNQGQSNNGPLKFNFAKDYTHISFAKISNLENLFVNSDFHKCNSLLSLSITNAEFPKKGSTFHYFS